ncbi:MAG: hypothetical protein FWD74_12620 [Actinomycetia bacterium]|nr:hypothetical protein [Actinomycetes bacterium]
MTALQTPRRQMTARLFLIGVRSVLDLSGQATFERVREQMPNPVRRPPAVALRQVAEQMAPTLSL